MSYVYENIYIYLSFYVRTHLKGFLLLDSKLKYYNLSQPFTPLKSLSGLLDKQHTSVYRNLAVAVSTPPSSILSMFNISKFCRVPPFQGVKFKPQVSSQTKSANLSL